MDRLKSAGGEALKMMKGALSCRILVLVIALVLLLSVRGLASTPKDVKRVLVLYSLDKGTRPTI